MAYFRPRLTAAAGIEAHTLLTSGVPASVPALTRALGIIYLRDGLAAWTLLDDDGDEVPVEAALGGTLDWNETLLPIADEADKIYSPGVMRPLEEAAEKLRKANEKAAKRKASAATRKSSPNGRARRSTSRTSTSSQPTPMQ